MAVFYTAIGQICTLIKKGSFNLRANSLRAYFVR